MNKLELKHLAPYLPFKLKAVLTTDKREDWTEEDYFDNEDAFKSGAIWELIGINNAKDLHIPIGEGELNGFLYSNGSTYVNFHYDILPILRPLSDLTKEIEHRGYKAKTENLLIGNQGEWLTSTNRVMGLGRMCVSDYELLLAHHYDVFNLIENGLAIDINTLETNPYK